MGRAVQAEGTLCKAKVGKEFGVFEEQKGSHMMRMWLAKGKRTGDNAHLEDLMVLELCFLKAFSELTPQSLWTNQHRKS